MTDCCGETPQERFRRGLALALLLSLLVWLGLGVVVERWWGR